MEIAGEIGQWVGILGIIGGALLWLHKKVIKPTVVNFNRWQDAIDKMALEFKPNGGTSIRDSLNRLEQSVAKLRGISKVILLDNEEGIFETDATGKCVYVNRTYEKITGRSFSELEGDGWHIVIHPVDAARVTYEWDTCIKQEREFNMEFQYRLPNGDAIPVRVIALPIKDPSAKTPTVMGYLGRTAIIKG